MSLVWAKMLVISDVKTPVFAWITLLSHIVWGQKNLVDIPTAEIVEKNKLFLQLQASYAPRNLSTGVTLTYGAGRNFDFGLTLHQFVFQHGKGLEIDPSQPENNPDFLCNVQKGFPLNERSAISCGTRTGINAADNGSRIGLVTFDYLAVHLRTKKDHLLVGGVFYGNEPYSGKSNTWGAMGGFDIPVFRNKLNFVGDLTTGNNSLSVINGAVDLSLGQEWKLTIGAQIPFPGSSNQEGVYLQIAKN